ncbi:helix-turn-helix transcriptional regulator [Ideonella sp. A 288]|uniref:helix-turn-helix transcriptional regulator n=1 Tax=Ideonella sp. A 288 TaxID=1962181 RepID=UPI000B4AFF98|nr:helix-turn-helix transcriptional regulator [Ideonella sp. A 288]
MNTETFGKTLLELYRLARTVPMHQFQRLALDAIGARLDFDTAWWGMASRSPGEDLEIHSSLPYRLPASYPALWDAIKQEDTIAAAVLAAPGTTVNFSRKQLYASPGLASLMARFGITGCLCTVTMLPELNLMCFTSMYRLEGKPAFSENERRYKQLLMPHLTAALTSNWMLHLERTRAARTGPARTALAVVDRRGMLYVADQGLSELLRRDWPNWSGPLLPPVLVDHLRTMTPYRGTRLTVRFHAVGDLWLVDLRPLTDAGRLSPREADIARRFSDGASYKEVAKALGIAPTTARHHLREIYRKLDVSDKAELARKLQHEPDDLLDVEGLPTLQELPGALTTFDRLPIG